MESRLVLGWSLEARSGRDTAKGSSLSLEVEPEQASVI